MILQLPQCFLKEIRPVLIILIGFSVGRLPAEEPVVYNVWTRPESPAWYREPFKLRLDDGTPLDMAAQITELDYSGGTNDTAGHAGPFLGCVRTHYRNLPDLVVGGFSGRFRVFRNYGSSGFPRFDAHYSYLNAGDQFALARNYCCVAAAPHFVDLDGDGILDFFCSSYISGFQWAKGLPNGKFAPLQFFETAKGAILTIHPEKLKNSTGETVLLTPRIKLAAAQFETTPSSKTTQDAAGRTVEWADVFEALDDNLGSFCDVIDWDNDGKLDLLVGTVRGEIYLFRNEGTKNLPRFADEPVEIRIDGRKALPDQHAAVSVADWDGDGLPDIIVGTYTGAVYLLRNSGKLGAPVFNTREQLIPPGEHEQWLEPGEEARRGYRAQVQVVDYNEDGKPDLILGDCSETFTPRGNLSAEEWQQMRAIQSKLAEIWSGQDYRADPQSLTALTQGRQQQYQELRSSLQPYLEQYRATYGTSLGKNHGFVWIFLHR